MANDTGTAGSPSTLFGRRDPVFRPWPLPDKEPANIADFVRRVKAQGSEFRKLTEKSLRKDIEERQARRDAGEASDGDDGDDNASSDHEDEEATLGSKALLQRPKGIEEMIARREEVLRALESALQNGLIVVDFISLLLSKDRPTQALQTLSPLLREKIGIGTLSAGRVANVAQAAKALQTRQGKRGGPSNGYGSYGNYNNYNGLSNGGGGSSGGGSNGGGNGNGSDSHLQNLDETTRFNVQRVLDHKIECVGWQLLAMDRAAELLAAGRKRLHAELRREQTYWSEVVAVRDRGWGLSRMPGQRRVLRVKFGFSEAAADLRAAGFAPLRRVRRGHVALDISALGPPSAVVVTLRRRQSKSGLQSVLIGRSPAPARLPDSAPLENRILEARNTIYAKELWRELNREARALVAHGVVLRGSQIVFSIGTHTEATVALEPLELAHAAESGPVSFVSETAETAGTETLTETETADTGLASRAEAMCSALHLFLAHGHRHHYRQRSVPAPPTDSAGAAPPAYFMLRPILANIKYERAIDNIARFLADLCTILHDGLGFLDARFTLYERPLSSFVPPPMPAQATAAARQFSASEGLCMGYLNPREFTFELAVTPDIRFSIRSRTTSIPLRTMYLVQLLPTPSSLQPPLQNTFSPADSYATLSDVLDYVGDAVAHVLATQAHSTAAAAQVKESSGDGSSSGGSGSGSDVVVWTRDVDGMSVHRQSDPSWQISFRVVAQDAITNIDKLIHNSCLSIPPPDNRRDDDGGEGDGEGGSERKTGKTGETDKTDKAGTEAVYSADSPLQRFRPPELRVYASRPLSADNSIEYHVWKWTAVDMQRDGAEKLGTLDDIVQSCVTGESRSTAEGQAKANLK